jgi:pimeloyl-ACP methyl ester carboxylesterase
MATRPGTEYALVEKAGHLVHDDRPDEYRAAVEDFLSRLEPPTSR